MMNTFIPSPSLPRAKRALASIVAATMISGCSTLSPRDRVGDDLRLTLAEATSPYSRVDIHCINWMNPPYKAEQMGEYLISAENKPDFEKYVQKIGQDAMEIAKKADVNKDGILVHSEVQGLLNKD